APADPDRKAPAWAAYTADVVTIVTTPSPSCVPNPRPTTQPRYRPSQSSLTCRRVVGRRRPRIPRSTTAPARTIAASATIRGAVATPPAAHRPAAPSSPPAAAPAAVAPTANHAAVTPHLDRLARSPSGLMLPSIDSPQGDHAERTPATAASAAARPVRTSPPDIVDRPLAPVQARVAR